MIGGEFVLLGTEGGAVVRQGGLSGGQSGPVLSQLRLGSGQRRLVVCQFQARAVELCEVSRQLVSGAAECDLVEVEFVVRGRQRRGVAEQFGERPVEQLEVVLQVGAKVSAVVGRTAGDRRIAGRAVGRNRLVGRARVAGRADDDRWRRVVGRADDRRSRRRRRVIGRADDRRSRRRRRGIGRADDRRSRRWRRVIGRADDRRGRRRRRVVGRADDRRRRGVTRLVRVGRRARQADRRSRMVAVVRRTSRSAVGVNDDRRQAAPALVALEDAVGRVATRQLHEVGTVIGGRKILVIRDRVVGVVDRDAAVCAVVGDLGGADVRVGCDRIHLNEGAVSEHQRPLLVRPVGRDAVGVLVRVAPLAHFLLAAGVLDGDGRAGDVDRVATAGGVGDRLTGRGLRQLPVQSALPVWVVRHAHRHPGRAGDRGTVVDLDAVDRRADAELLGLEPDVLRAADQRRQLSEVVEIADRRHGAVFQVLDAKPAVSAVGLLVVDDRGVVLLARDEVGDPGGQVHACPCAGSFFARYSLR